MNVDEERVPRRGRWTSDMKPDGKTVIRIYNRHGGKVLTLQYRQAERIEFRPR